MDVLGVLFDLGGTLVWPEPPGEMLFCEACQLIGFQVSPCDLLRVTADVDRQMYVPLPITRNQEADFFAYGNMMTLKKLGFEATLSHGWFIHHYIHDRIHYHKFYDVDNVLATLKGAGLRLGLVSNAVPSTRDRIMRLALDKYFDTIILSGEFGYEKPDPEIFEAALKNISLKPEETVHVGDNYHADVEGAHGTGITPVLMDRAGKYSDLDCITVKNLMEFQELMRIFK
jgi:HAD superfamily hydrolase (TIGR01509 family)